MKPIEQAFLADILESPDDDAPRLIYADWLEENGQAERAEFIHVQCELASLVEPEKGMCSCLYGSCDQCCYRRQFARHKHSLRRRERELLPTNAWDWAGEMFRDAWIAGTYHQDVLVFRRGFIEEITLTLADWLRHGPALVRAAPLRMVRLSNVQLVHGSNDGFMWVFPYIAHDALFPDGSVEYFRELLWTFYVAKESAIAAMSRCCLEYARGQNTKIVQA